MLSPLGNRWRWALVRGVSNNVSMDSRGGCLSSSSILECTVSESHSRAGRKGARRFWKRFHSDPEFRDAMMAAWRNKKFSREMNKKAARLGGKALWHRYYSDPEFRRRLDEKLRKSRSRGGSVSLRNLGEHAFKKRLVLWRGKEPYVDSRGNRLRSSLELRIAELLIKSKIDFIVEPKMEVKDHGFYPDFQVSSNKNHRGCWLCWRFLLESHRS